MTNDAKHAANPPLLPPKRRVPYQPLDRARRAPVARFNPFHVGKGKHGGQFGHKGDAGAGADAGADGAAEFEPGTLARGLLHGIGGGASEDDFHQIVSHQWGNLDGDQHNAVVAAAVELDAGGFLSDPQPADLADVVDQFQADAAEFDADTVARSVVHGIRTRDVEPDPDAMRDLVAHHYGHLTRGQQNDVVQATLAAHGHAADQPSAKDLIAQLTLKPGHGGLTHPH